MSTRSFVSPSPSSITIPGPENPSGNGASGAEYPTLAALIRNVPAASSGNSKRPSVSAVTTIGWNSLRLSCAGRRRTGKRGSARTCARDSARPSVLTTRPRMTPVWSGGAAASGAAKGATNVKLPWAVWAAGYDEVDRGAFVAGVKAQRLGVGR